MTEHGDARGDVFDIVPRMSSTVLRFSVKFLNFSR